MWRNLRILWRRMTIFIWQHWRLSWAKEERLRDRWELHLLQLRVPRGLERVPASSCSRSATPGSLWRRSQNYHGRKRWFFMDISKCVWSQSRNLLPWHVRIALLPLRNIGFIAKNPLCRLLHVSLPHLFGLASICRLACRQIVFLAAPLLF